MKSDHIYELDGNLEDVKPAGTDGATFMFRVGHNKIYLMTVPLRELKLLIEKPEKWIVDRFRTRA